MVTVNGVEDCSLNIFNVVVKTTIRGLQAVATFRELQCKEWVVWSDSITNCIKCDDHKCNDNWQDGFERGGGH